MKVLRLYGKGKLLKKPKVVPDVFCVSIKGEEDFDMMLSDGGSSIKRDVKSLTVHCHLLDKFGKCIAEMDHGHLYPGATLNSDASLIVVGRCEEGDYYYKQGWEIIREDPRTCK